MTLKDSLKKLNKTALVLSLIHFVISFFTDRLIFTYAWFDASTTKQLLRSVETIAVKAVFLLVLILLWQAVFWAAKNADRRFLKVAGGYMLLMLLLLVLTWPGVWRMDEFGLLSSSVNLFPHFWQNYITSVFYILALMLLPFPAGVVIVQCACVSLIVARLFCLCVRESKTKRNSWILIIPFLMFPVLDSNLYPLRMSLYAFLEVLMIGELFFLAKLLMKEHAQYNSLNNISYWIYMTVLAAVVTVWRTEAIYYLAAYPVFLLVIGKGRRFIKQILIYIILFVILFVPQKIGERLTSGQQYELTGMVLPLVPLVEAAHENADAQDSELLEVIDRVVNVEVTLQGAKEGKTGINLFWGEPDFQRTYTTQEFAEFKSAYYQLVIKYPLIFLNERWNTFCESCDLLENTTELFTRDNVPNYQTFRDYPLSRPINNDLRTCVIKMLEFRSSDAYDLKLKVADVVYSVIPAVIILIIASVILLCKKRWTSLLLLITVLVKVPLVFLTAPSRLFMYYYSVYLFGYCVLFYVIYRVIVTAKAEKV